MVVAQAVAQVVDVLLEGVGGGEVGVVVVVEVGVHGVEGATDEGAHLGEVVVEGVAEVGGVGALALADEGYVVDVVADALEVVGDAEHGGDAL